MVLSTEDLATAFCVEMSLLLKLSDCCLGAKEITYYWITDCIEFSFISISDYYRNLLPTVKLHGLDIQDVICNLQSEYIV